ncbi:DUF4373 domain-containing protein [Fibrivirga algicola]|uniref:DUF4373 domain-containing protein n=1 Tax=Fibrivirga algicola TaxID=2950420 RepID=A0ABX0QDQ0_9BACT|nr:DUF4373 domain-containing protein [Fibrivirga algicola]NID09345.1 DUF4373 domain-containing protein [Fibrivirga algicola]
MARPARYNAEYFTHNADFRNDRRVKAIRSNFGAAGYGLTLMLLEILTDSDHTQLCTDDLELELLSGDLGVSVTEIHSLLQLAEKIGFFSRNDAGLLICPDLNRVLEPVFEKRNRARNSPKPDSAVVSVAETTETGVSVTETTQSKVKESKEEESKKNGSSNDLGKDRSGVADATDAPTQVVPSSYPSALRQTPSFAKPTTPVVPNEAPAAKKSATVDKRTYGDGMLQEQCRDYYKANLDKYPADLYNEFLAHWTAITQNAKKKADNGKELWRTRETFDLAGRLSTWKQNQEKFSNGNQPDKRTPTPGRIDAKSTSGATAKWRGNKLIRPGSTPESI